jgi:hypothetical protein
MTQISRCCRGLFLLVTHLPLFAVLKKNVLFYGFPLFFWEVGMDLGNCIFKSPLMIIEKKKNHLNFSIGRKK